MTPEITLLTLSAATIAFAHTILGPDHYLPFVAMAQARNWSTFKTFRITLVCGVGHILGSVMLGVVGITLGTQLSSLEWFEGLRGGMAAWALTGFGVMYTAWGLRLAYRKKPHTHWHEDAGLKYCHKHNHDEHLEHAHESGKRSLTPWLIFLIFVLGPCEPLIPLLMYPAATENAVAVLLVTGVFGLVTVLTMTMMVILVSLGLKTIKLSRFEHYSHAVAGSTILVCGLSVVFLGI